jgi:hypothetical protein
MKRTSVCRVFGWFYLGLLVAGLIALAVDSTQQVYSHFAHAGGAHGWPHFAHWRHFALKYGLLGIPIVFLASCFVCRVINCFFTDPKDFVEPASRRTNP